MGDILGGFLYISAFSLVYLKKAYDHCLELGITRKELSNVIKSSLIFSVVPSLSIVVGLFVLIAVLGSVWAWWRLSVIGSLSYETMISSSIAQVLGYASSAEMLESATGRQFGVVMILMSVGMLSGFLILLPFGKKLCKSVDRSAAESGGSTWKNVLSGVFMLVMFSVYIPILLFTDNVQAAVMITGLVIAIRISEFCGLTISEIEFGEMRIKVDHQLQRTAQMQYVIEEPKTDKGIRYVPMTEAVAACFRRIIANRKTPKVEPMVEGYAGFLFLDKNDMPMVALHWEKYLEHIIQKYNRIYRIQMPKVTPHVCRHTFCSNMAKSGMNPKTLQYIMGHADISVTLNTYTHVNFDDAKEEVYRIANS